LCNGSALSIPLGIRLVTALIMHASVFRISRFDDKTRPFGLDFLAIVIVVIMYARDIPRFGRGSWIFLRT
jgi:hypothetical protein